MTTAQSKAVKQYRDQQRKKGFVRMEVSIPKEDRELVKAVVANLRAGGQLATNTRQLLKNIQNPYFGMNFKELLEAAPIDELDLERSPERTREIDL